MTVTGITAVTPGPLIPLLPSFNFNIIYNIKEGNNFSTLIPQTDSWLIAKILNF